MAELWPLQLKDTPTADVIVDPFSKVNECATTRQCWEGSEPFSGGSLPWEGTKEQKAARRAAAAEAKAREPECTWAPCPEVTCPPFRCSGYFSQANRPPCRELTQPQQKKKNIWCWEEEGHLLTHCGKCEPSVYECLPLKHPEGRCPTRPTSDIPLFIWHDGYPFFNKGGVPHPYLTEELKPPPTPLRPRDDPTFVPNPFRDPRSFDLCDVLFGGAGRRTYQKCIEKQREEELWGPKYVCTLPLAASVPCRPLPKGGARTPPPPFCGPCACPW